MFLRRNHTMSSSLSLHAAANMHPHGEVASATKRGAGPTRSAVTRLRTHFRDRRRALRKTDRGVEECFSSPSLAKASSEDEPSDSSDEKLLAFALGTPRLLLHTLKAWG